MREKKTLLGNTRRSSRNQRKHQHLLDVKIRSGKVMAQRTRRVMFWLCVGVLLVSAVGGGYYGIREGLRKFVWENPDYNLQEIAFTTDGTLTRQQVMECAQIREGGNIFQVNLEEAQGRIEAMTQVEHVALERTLPNKIAVNISERKPIAWIAATNRKDRTAAEDSLLVDRRGVLMRAKSSLSEYVHLPIIHGINVDKLDTGTTTSLPEFKAALDLIRLNADSPTQTRFQVRSIDLSKGYCMIVTDEKHAQITFGLERIDWQLERLAVYLNRVDESKKELRTINLLVQRNVPVTFVEEEEVEAATSAPEVKKEKPPLVRSELITDKPKATMTPRRAQPVIRAKPVVAMRKAIPVSTPKPRANNNG